MDQTNILLGLAIVFCIRDVSCSALSNLENTNDEKGPDTQLPFASKLGVFESAAVSADGVPCAQIGSDILQQNGTAIDAAIASLFCVGVVNTQSMGIGGGFVLTYYEKSSGQSITLDSRENAPAAAFAEMYENDTTLGQFGSLAVAVPGETRGYWEAYQRFGGGVPWASLIQPTIDLCENGFPVNYHMANNLRRKEEYILNEPSMSVFLNPETGRVWQEGDHLYRKDLSPTLRRLQEEPDALYTGSLSGAFLEDLTSLGSIITADDLASYKPQWKEPISIHLKNGDYTVLTMPPPGSGVIYSLIMNILDNFNFTPDSLGPTEIVTTYHRIVEAFKFAYAERMELGDPEFTDLSKLIANLTSEEFAYDVYSKINDQITYQEPEHYGAKHTAKDLHGTSPLSVLAPNGDAVAVTSTINWTFGSVTRSVQTGIILNNEMDDFFTGPYSPDPYGFYPSQTNRIEPGKSPRSSMTPTIVLDNKGNVRQIIGAAGGSHITTSVAWVSLHNLYFGENIKEAIDRKRLHHTLLPMILRYEEGFNQEIVEGLREKGHVMEEYSSGSVVCGISTDSAGRIYANSDVRKRGEVDGF